MNKKGFTLVELLAVIAIIAIIAVIAIPNVVRLVDNSKKEQFLSDAKAMISNAKYKYKFVDGKYSTLFDNENGCKVIILSNLDLDITNDADGNQYDKSNSKVKVCVSGGNVNYYVKLTSGGSGTRGVFEKDTYDYILESNLSKDSINTRN